MEGQPGWFGPPDRPLFGWVHAPDHATARATVVVCPSLGQEGVFTHYALLQLAERLVAQGFVVIRFDYDGTGDSAGAVRDPDRVEAWLSSIEHAADLGRSVSGAPLVLVGMRLGGLLAARAATTLDVHGLVLWDVPRSGSAYVREQRIRQSTSPGEHSEGSEGVDGELTAMGLDLAAETVASVQSLDLRGQALPATIALSVERAVSRLSRSAGPTRGGHRVDRLEDLEQDELLYRQTTPETTLGDIVDWLSKSYPESDVHPVSRDHVPELMSSSLELGDVRETVVRIGPHRLFGITTEALQPQSETTVVFVPEVYTPHVGLSRVWTDLARSWAHRGVGSLRFDLSGCGDSPPHEGRPGHRVAIVEHIEDVVEALTWTRSDSAPLAIPVGLCSGAYLGLEAAARLRLPGLVLINPSYATTSAEYPPSPVRLANQHSRPLWTKLFGGLAGRLAQRLSRPEWAPALVSDPAFDWGRSFEVGLWKNYLLRIAPWLPDPIWRLLNFIMLEDRAVTTFRRLARRGTRTLLVSGDADWRKAVVGLEGTLRSLERRDLVHTVREPLLDHALMEHGARQRLIRRLDEQLDWLVGASTSAPPADASPPVEELRAQEPSQL